MAEEYQTECCNSKCLLATNNSTCKPNPVNNDDKSPQQQETQVPDSGGRIEEDGRENHFVKLTKGTHPPSGLCLLACSAWISKT
jgi:hypothetical protein